MTEWLKNESFTSRGKIAKKCGEICNARLLTFLPFYSCTPNFPVTDVMSLKSKIGARRLEARTMLFIYRFWLCAHEVNEQERKINFAREHVYDR